MNTSLILQEIGMSQLESDIYLKSLSIGPVSVLTLSKITQIHRPRLYKVLEKLIDQGIFSTTLQGKRKLYVAIEPKQLLGYLKRKENLLREAIPELSALASNGMKKPKITYYEGRDQLKELFKSGLKAKSKLMYSFFPSKYMAQIFGQREMEAIIHERIKAGIHAKALRASQAEVDFEGSGLTREAFRDYRYLPNNQFFEMGIVIFDNTVNLFAPIEENFGLQIQSESYAKLMKYFFDNIWQVSQEVKA